ncbi:putative disease resistance protein RGA3 [Typha angustifolia]|uniref:putative disease resistance protein RGA3 n=1 Tax=Typha angustifolia TaxID=59011 RepID=UPI003C2C7809
MAMVAGMFGSAFVGELVSRASSFLGGRYKLHSNVGEKLKSLKVFLIKIQSVVLAAEAKEIHNRALVQWLEEFKNLAYQADDVLDTFAYRELEQKVNEGEVGSSSAISLSNVFKRFRKVGKFTALRQEDVNELSSLLEKLERHAAHVRDFLELLNLDGRKRPTITSQRITGSLPTIRHGFVGREKEKEDIINFLLKTESHANERIPVLPILGIGGMGKTTLAQYVYNDERVKSHFSLKMWICVSESFDVVKLTREMLDQSDSPYNHTGVQSFGRLQAMLRKMLRTETFLLVLDDVWNETEREAWNTVKAPLYAGKNGSKILLTSRLEKVAKLMGTVNPIKIEGLLEDDYWSLFTECAFGDAKPEEHPRLAAIGKKVASRLKGSPLAAKTIGALLKDNLDDDHWESISRSDIWELEQGQDGIMAALKLSYLHLPTHLQQCFAYLSIYPKDWEFNREDVVGLWMALGMIHQDSRTKRIEDIIVDYFNELISKSFVKSAVTKNFYTLHDLLHDLAESVSKNDIYRIEDDEDDTLRTIPTSVHHLSLSTDNLATLKKNVVLLNNLRALIFVLPFKIFRDKDDLHDVFRRLKRIRALSLRHWDVYSLPDTLSSLIHLRYLDLSFTCISRLPDELTKLYHLQTLNLDRLELSYVPESMNKLINLRYLVCSNKVLSMIAGIGKMTCLQKLSCPFSVQNVHGFEIGQLKYLRELRQCLTIKNLENLLSKEDAEEARLWDKHNLVELRLYWEYPERDANPELANGVLEGLQPHPNLKELLIDGYKGTRPPSWMICHHPFTNFVRLELSNCRSWKDLPPLGQLPWLKILVLQGMHAIKEVGPGFYGSGPVKGFPSLESLTFDDLPEWEVWSAVEEAHSFPHLLTLKILECPKLIAIPPLPPILQKLGLFSVGVNDYPKFLRTACPSSLPSSSSSSLSLRLLAITECRKLESPVEWLLEQHERLKHLEDLFIGSLCELNPLFVKAINKFTGLKNLVIRRLQSMEDDGEEDLAENVENYDDEEDEDEESSLLLQSLETLDISAFVTEEILSRHLQGLSSLQSLMIRDCPLITALSFAEGLEHFRRLTRLSIINCDEFTSLAGLKALHSLEELEVIGCPKLTLLPSSESDEVEVVEEDVGLSALSSLCIDDTLLLKLLLNREGLATLKNLEIRHSHQQEINEEAFQHLTSLETLRVEDCPNLQSLPELQNLHSLITLEIEDCGNFRSLCSFQGLPASLFMLSVHRCHPVFKELYNGHDGTEWWTIDHINLISIE